MTKEADINGKKFGESNIINIQLTVKNLLIVLGFIATTVTGAYFALKSDIGSVKTGIEQIKNEDLKIIYNQLNQIDGKVQVLVSGGGNTNWNGNSGGTNTGDRPTNTGDLPDMN